MTGRVLHVIPAVASRYGGPSAAVLGMTRALRAAGTDAVVATTDADGPGRLPVPCGIETEIAGVPAVVFARRGGESYKWSAGLARWLKARVTEFSVVHVHAVFSHSTAAAGRACRAANVPYLIRPLGTLDPWSLERHALRKRALLRLGLRRVLDRAAAMHYTTAEERRLAESALPGLPRGVVVPLGIDDSWFAPADSAVGTRRREIVVMARLDPKKAIDVAIRAFHRAAAHPALGAVRLRIAGSGDAAYERTLRTIAANGPAADRITFCGWLDGAARMAAVSDAALFLMPSHQENFGVAAVEAMARATPVVVAPGVNLAPAITAAGAGWTVPADDEAFAGAMVVAFDNEDARRRAALAARQFAEQFRWPAVAAALQDVYASVVH